MKLYCPKCNKTTKIYCKDEKGNIAIGCIGVCENDKCAENIENDRLAKLENNTFLNYSFLVEKEFIK